jgi:hypothetical protein
LAIEPFASERVQHLQQLRSQQLFRRNRRTAYASVHRVKASRELPEYLVYHGPNRAQRMILTHALFGRQVTEYMILLLIISAHAFS